MRKIWLVVGAATVVAAGAYAARWRANYKRVVAEDAQRSLEAQNAPQTPEDIAGAVELTEDELALFEEIEEKTCLGPCCVDQDALDELMYLDDQKDGDEK